ncbi:hypothetical protein [Actinacidiphila sp. bgisy160]|uniref:hypothetical protein n=1 Tax=Actinacidiphila sp. bgisy160 TaxID=3413796 RepID=UPI003D7430B3
MISNEDLNARVRITRFAQQLDQLSRRLDTIERSAQASFTSVEGGTFDVFDADGELALSIGVQDDGAAAVVYHSPEPPPTPSTPIAEGVIGAIQVTWDGQFTDAGTAPTDFARIQIHLLPSAEAPVDTGAPAATIETATGASVAVATDLYTPQYVRLIAVSKAGVPGAPSEAATAAARKLVGDDLLNGIIDDLKLADDAVTEGKIALGAVKSTAIADGAILEEKLAANAVTLGKIASGAVTINALGGALSDLAAQRYVDAMGDPAAWQVTDSQPGSTWQHLSGITDAPTGQTVGQAKGYNRVRGTTLIAYEPGTVYRISGRVRLTGPVAGNEAFYVGALGIGADKTTLVNRSGANSPSSHYYVAASGKPIADSDGWVTVVGYLKDRAATGVNGSAGPNTDPRAAGLVHADVRFISPYLWLNYLSATVPNSTSVMQVDCVTVEALKTGLVDSTNFVAGSVTTAALAADAVTAGKVAADAITARELAANSVTATEIAAGSVTAAAVAAGAITADKLTISGGANILSDPSFEGAYTAQIVASSSVWSVDSTKGNGSAKSLKVNAVNTGLATRTQILTTLPISPGDQLYIAYDYQASTDYTPGAIIKMYARWEDSSGTAIGFGSTQTASPVLGPTWQRLSNTVTAPANAVRAVICAESFQAQAGTLWFDNAAVRPVLPGTQIADGAITTAKMVANTINGDRITANTLDASKIVAASITAAQIQGLAITGDKIAANTIDATNIKAGAIQAAALAADAITGKTITGGTITGAIVNGSTLRTGATGTRIELVPDDGSAQHDPVLRFFTGAAGETIPATAEASGTFGYFTLSAPQYGQGSALVNVATPKDAGDHGFIELFMGQNGGRPNPNLYMDGGTGTISLFASNGGGSGGTFYEFSGKALTVDTWHTATLNSAQWVPYGAPYAAPGYQERPDGTIDLRGTMKPAASFTPVNGGVLFTLPFTLPFQERWDCRTNSTNGIATITVRTNGQVAIDDISGTVSWVMLGGVKGIPTQ